MIAFPFIVFGIYYGHACEATGYAAHDTCPGQVAMNKLNAMRFDIFNDLPNLQEDLCVIIGRKAIDDPPCCLDLLYYLVFPGQEIDIVKVVFFLVMFVQGFRQQHFRAAAS